MPAGRPWQLFREFSVMIIDPQLLVVSVERVGGDVIVEFGDGRHARFPGAFLRAHASWYLLGPESGEEDAELEDR